MIYCILGISFWLLCAFLSVGTDIAYFQEKFRSIAHETYRSDLSNAIGQGLLLGPVALLVGVFWSEFWRYGWYIRYRDVRPENMR